MSEHSRRTSADEVVTVVPDRGVGQVGSGDTIDSAATLELCARIVRTLCDGPTEESLAQAAAWLCVLPGVAGVRVEAEGAAVRSGDETGEEQAFPLGKDPTLGRLVVLRRSGDQAESQTEQALAVVVPVLGGVLTQRRTAERLMQRERSSKGAVETALDAIVSMGGDGVVRDFNPAAERIFGYPREDVVGRRMAEVLVPEPYRAAHVAGVERYMRTRRGKILGQRIEMPATRADGSVITVELAIVATDIEGDVEFTAFLRDVTEARETRRRLEDTTSRLRTLISSLNAAVLVEDEHRRVVVVNEAFTRMFRLASPPEELYGADGAAIFEETAHLFAEPTVLAAVMARRLADRRLVTGEQLVTEDGRVLERDYVPVFRGEEFHGHLWLHRDITARKRAEHRLEEQNRMLADLARMKDRFVATVSHELRTPLTSIIGFSEILARPETGPLTDDQRAYVEVIHRNARQLLVLGNDLLTVVSAEAEGLRLDVVALDVAEVVRAAVAEHAARAEEGGVRVVTRLPAHLAAEGDAARLRQVLDNLLGNAVKYTPPGGVVTVALEVEPGRWRLEVDDTGIGIPRAEQERLFTSFFRGSNTRSHVTPGTGLGLVITRAIVELHGGAIAIASDEGRGTTVTVTLPLHVAGGTRGVVA